ncbi:MAG TPA: hypothetical protein V6D28_14225 [Leptolyngbyaceae cyanobacterium]
MKFLLLSFLHISFLAIAAGFAVRPAFSLPPAEDIPEEVLRTEIVIEARSPIDGKPLTPAEYAELKAELERIPSQPPQVNPEIQHLIFLLRVSEPLRKLFPFVRF